VLPDVITPAIAGLGGLIGFNVDATKLLLSAIISLLAGAGLARWSKSGNLGIAAMVVFLLVFTGAGWVNIWFLIIISILCAYIISKWGTQAVSPGV
jgi:hypothetical protein